MSTGLHIEGGDSCSRQSVPSNISTIKWLEPFENFQACHFAQVVQLFIARELFTLLKVALEKQTLLVSSRGLQYSEFMVLCNDPDGAHFNVFYRPSAI